MKVYTITYVFSSVADQEPDSGAFSTPGSGIGKKSGSGMNIPDHTSERLETIFRLNTYSLMRIRDLFDLDPESRVEKFENLKGLGHEMGKSFVNGRAFNFSDGASAFTLSACIWSTFSS